MTVNIKPSILVSLILAALAVPLALSGCSTAAASTEPAPTVAVLADTGQSLTRYEKDRTALLGKAESLGARVIIDGVGVTNSLTDVDLVGDGVNALERKKDLAKKTRSISESFTALQSTAPKATLNLFASLKELSNTLHSGPSSGPVDVVLLSTMVNTAEPANLAATGALSDPAVPINSLAKAGLIPDCRGWSFHAVSPGDPAHPDINDAALEAFWRAYAERCGGKLVAWSPTLDAFPGDRREVAFTDTKQLSVQHAESGTTVTLKSVNFAPDSPVLTDAAGAALRQVIGMIEETTGPVSIVGYTDLGATGFPGGLSALSLARANSVKAWMVANGVDESRISTAGKGSNDPLYPNPTTDDQHSANRRVVVTFGGK